MIGDGKISAHVTLSELTRSDTASRLGIDNSPGTEEITALKLLCTNVYEKVRNHFGFPIYISSGYRCQELNERIGGALNSQHIKGEAIDLDCSVFGHGTNLELYNYIKDNLEYDQLIFEGKGGKWIHVSYRLGKNRKQAFAIPNP